jgi:hypothetical protein
MKLSEYQSIAEKANSRTASRSDCAAASSQLATAQVTGTVYRPVYFGSGSAKGEFVDLVSSSFGVRKSEAKRLIKESTVECDGGVIAYSDPRIAHCEGQDHVGMGSCTAYRVVEADPEHAWAADISDTKGLGWRMI